MLYKISISKAYIMSTLLGDILRIRQWNKNSLKYVYKKSNCGHIVVMPYSATQESFSRDSRDKGWVEKCCSVCRVESRKIIWPWKNTSQIICSRDTLSYFVRFLVWVSSNQFHESIITVWYVWWCQCNDLLDWEQYAII